MQGNKKLQLKKNGLRVLNAQEAAQVAGGTGYEPTYDPGDCLYTDVCASGGNCTTGGGSGGTGCGASGYSAGCPSGHAACEKEYPVTYE